jgi:N-acetylglucosaminyl-diphospho-decaprenol L-rhamnosyltransferase
MSEIAVAIVNYNTRDDLRACLASVQQTGAPEVVVVDNASADGSAAMIQEEFPAVILCANQANTGYGSAANQAIRRCQAEHVLLLNSDTLIQPKTLDILDNYLSNHSQVAIAGPRLHNPDGTLQPSAYPFPTPLHIFLEESTLGRLIRHLPWLRQRYLRTWSHDYIRPVPWLLGAALAIRRQPFTAIGGFDTSYFMYAEETDLCYRLRAAGWDIHFVPDATIVHTGGASTRQYRTAMAVQFFTSIRHFYRQHYSWLRQLELMLIIKAIVFARFLRERTRLLLAEEGDTRQRIEHDLSAWQQLLWGNTPGGRHG